MSEVGVKCKPDSRDLPLWPGIIIQMLPYKEGQKSDTWLAGEACEKKPPLEGPGKHKAGLQTESL